MTGIAKCRENRRWWGWLSIAIWVVGLGMTKEGVAQTQTIEIENRTGIPAKIEVRSSKYSGAEIDRYVEKLEIPIAGTGKAKIPARKGKLEWVRLDLLTDFGRAHLIWSPKGNANRFQIPPEQVPIVGRQEGWYPWKNDEGRKCEAKLIGIVAKGDVRKAALLKENGEIKYIATTRLSKADQMVLRGVEKGAHRWAWYIGGSLIEQEQLKGEMVTIVLSQKKESEQIFGPVLKGTIVDVVDEKLIFSGEGEQHLMRLTGRKVQGFKVERGEIRMSPKILGSFDQPVGHSALEVAGIDSIIVGDTMYVPKGKATLKRVESTAFWHALAEGKTDLFYWPDQLRTEKGGRAAMVGIAAMGAILVGLGAMESKEGFVRPSGKPINDCSIEGKAAPHTKVLFGGGIGTYSTTHSNARGEYVIHLFLRPLKENDYYLDVEIGGKRVRKWTGKLDGYGRNVIDLR